MTTKDEIKNRISMALKSPVLQQGFEIICRENAKLEKACDETQELLDKQIEATYKLAKENTELKAEIQNLEGIKLAQETALSTEYMIEEQLQKENAELKAQIEKMKCCQNCKNEGEDYYGNSYCRINKSFWNCDKWEIKE